MSSPEPPGPKPLEPESIQSAIRAGRYVSDVAFDQLFPSPQRDRSPVHWTPIDVARRACAMLAPTADQVVLDVGSGVGKLCLIGALTTRATWHGIERDRRMVRAANVAARQLEVADRARFEAGEVAELDWTRFDAFYLFNPFAEALGARHVDPVIRQGTYLETIAVVERKLSAVRIDARVVTYHGFGGELPSGFELVHREEARADELCLWIRRGRRRGAKPTIPLA